MRKTFSLLLVICVIILTHHCLVIDVNATNVTIADLQVKFPNGKYWNSGNPDTYTSSACTHHTPSNVDNCNVDGSCGCTYFGGGIQCTGFARKLTFEYYNGSSFTNWTTTSSKYSIKAGDVIRYGGGTWGHTAWVIARNGNDLTLAECNWYSACEISWGRQINIADIYNVTIYVAPYEITAYPNIGTDFYATIFHTSSWKPIELNSDGFLHLGTEDGDFSEKWHFNRLDDGSYTIRNANGMYLDIYGGYGSNGKELVTAEYTGNNSQQWYIDITEAGDVNIIAKQGFAIDLSGGNVSLGKVNLWELNDSAAQRWTIYKGESKSVEATSLTANAATADEHTFFSWNDGCYQTWFALKIWKGTVWDGEAYEVVKLPAEVTEYDLELPVGYYEAYVDANNALGCEMSNLVKFVVTPEKPEIVIHKEQEVLENISINWNEIKDTTHYNVYIYKKNESGQFEEVYRIMEYTDNKLSLSLTIGDYYTFVQAYNYNYRFPNHGDWIHTQSDSKFFKVEDMPYTISTVTKNGSRYTVNTELYGLSLTCTPIVAGYNNNKLVSIKLLDDSTCELNGDINIIKVMVWDELATLEPLCKVEEITSDKFIIE